MQRPGIEPATCRSPVQRPNHYTTEPPWWYDYLLWVEELVVAASRSRDDDDVDDLLTFVACDRAIVSVAMETVAAAASSARRSPGTLGTGLLGAPSPLSLSRGVMDVWIIDGKNVEVKIGKKRLKSVKNWQQLKNVCKRWIKSVKLRVHSMVPCTLWF